MRQINWFGVKVNTLIRLRVLKIYSEKMLYSRLSGTLNGGGLSREKGSLT